MKQSIVTGMGEALWDMLPEGKKIGGAPANFAYHISQFGIDSRVVSAVGKDTAGSELLENLRDKSLKGLIEKTDFPTGSVEVEVDEKGIPCYKSVAPDLNIYAKHTPNPAYIPYIIHSVSAKR